MISVSTERFWALSRRAGFVRTTRNSGRLGDAEFFVGVAPEDVPDFIEAKARETQALLMPAKPWWKRQAHVRAVVLLVMLWWAACGYVVWRVWPW